jgi:8-oxo-dGTP pyrophosphatase MutT (NUDIX family)
MVKYEVSAGGIVYKQVKSMSRVKSRDQKSQLHQGFGGQAKAQSIEWLICQHSEHKGWVFPKGLIGDTKQGEAMEEAALRETKEEGGVKAKIIDKLPKPVEYFYKFKGQLIKKTVYYYLMEITEAKFLSEDEVKKTLTYRSDKEAFIEAINLFNKLS